jgi:hypothetical protein
MFNGFHPPAMMARKGAGPLAGDVASSLNRLVHLL